MTNGDSSIFFSFLSNYFRVCVFHVKILDSSLTAEAMDPGYEWDLTEFSQPMYEKFQIFQWLLLKLEK